MKRQFLPEWQPQWGVLLAWPHHSTDWNDILDEAEQCYSEIITAITHYENVLLLCHDATHQAHIEQRLKQSKADLERIHWVHQPYNDTWARDFAPIAILDNGQPSFVNFTFNAWGNKYPAKLDNAVNAHLASLPLFANTTMQTNDIIMEGGSLETDGQGTLLTTEICLLNKNRNPDLSREEIENNLKESLGLEHILWLQHGHLEGDDTDAHIDTLARFSSPESIVYITCDDENDTHYADMKAMENELKALKQSNGEPYQLFPIPMPAAIYDEDRRLGASYVNYLVINEAVLLPIYGDKKADQFAIEQTQKAYSQHKVIPINCLALIKQNGSLHCITMQLPQTHLGAHS